MKTKLNLWLILLSFVYISCYLLAIDLVFSCVYVLFIFRSFDLFCLFLIAVITVFYRASIFDL